MAEKEALLHFDPDPSRRLPQRSDPSYHPKDASDDNMEELRDFADLSLEDLSEHEESVCSERLLLNRNDRHTSITDRSQPVFIQRRVGLIHAIALVVGSIIGSGIFISPSIVFKNSGSVGLTLLIWTLGGFVSLLGALCYCELGTMIGKSGGDFVYLKISYGKMAAFLYSWVNIWFVDPAGFAVSALTFSLYLSTLFNFQCENTVILKLLAGICILFLAILNCASVSWSARAQVVFTGAKLIGILLIVSVGCIRLFTGHTQHFEKVFAHSSTNAGNIGHAFYAVMWSYGGWSGLNSFTEEIKEPEKNFIRCMYISIPLVTICYVCINTAYFTVLNPAEMLSSEAVAFTFAHKLSPAFGLVMPLIVAISCIGSINGQVFGSSRVLFSIAREKQMPKFLSLVNRETQAPIPAILLRAVLGFVMLLPSTIEPLINCMTFISWAFYLAMFVAVILLRWKKPHLPRPYKVPLVFPIVMILVSCYFIATPFFVNPIESVIGLTVVIAGVPVYYVFLVKQWVPKLVIRLLEKGTYFSYLFCNVVEPAIPESFVHDVRSLLKKINN